MAVKPITNPNPKQAVNRVNEVKFEGASPRMMGNARRVLPAKDFSKNYAITLKDIDMAMMSHLKNVMDIKVRENGEMVKLPVIYGNEERWASIKRRGNLRDRNGSLILPLMVFRRTNVVFTDSMPQSFDQDVKGEHIQVTRASKYSKKNRYSRFNLQMGNLKQTENIVTGMPDFIDVSYEFFIWTNYTEQMNIILEAFIEHENCYWGDENNYRFIAAVEGGFSDATEQTVDTGRVVSSNFNIMLKAYVIPEVNASIIAGKTFEAQKITSPSKVVFSMEGISDPRELPD